LTKTLETYIVETATELNLYSYTTFIHVVLYSVVVSNIFLFSPLHGEMVQFDFYFSHGLKPPTSIT